uniref:RxLR effector candidate protein n=1 Tax=Hyaloperonospora arabidopsidis (strain Emoy2) TaxID=559515 RepID=M4BQS7_HYAAE
MGGSVVCGSREKRSAGYPSAGHVDDGSNHPAKRRSSYSSRSAHNSPTRSLSMSPVPRRELLQDYTLRPVVRLGTFEHVVSPSRPEEQEVYYEVMARD